MQDREILFFFTAEYPYGQGEAFIENELPYLLKRYREIRIFTGASGGEARAVPAGVTEISTLHARPGLAAVLRALTAVLFSPEIKELGSPFALRRFWFRLKVATLSYAHARAYATVIRSALPAGKENVTFYAYWCDDKAVSFLFLKKKFPHFRYYSRFHGWDLYAFRHQYDYLPFRKRLAGKLDGLFFISESGMRYFKEQYRPGATSSLRLSYLGTNDHGLNPVNDNRERLHVVSCSSVIGLKRLDLILNTLNALKVKVKWTHIGDGPLLEEIRQMSGNHPDIQVEFKGYMKPEQLFAYYSCTPVDFFINLSDTEGLPVSVMEALSMGIPVFARNVGAVSEAVTDERFLLNKSFDLEEAVSKITWYAHLSEDEKKSYRLSARQKWVRHFDAGNTYRKFCDQL